MTKIESKLGYKQISLAIAVAYAVCIAIFLGLRVLYVEGSYTKTTFIMFAFLCWIAAPQFILFQYVSRFGARWAQCVSLLLQIGLCSSLYNYGIPALTNDYDDIKYELAYWYLPIWHYAIVATTGLVMKIIKDY